MTVIATKTAKKSRPANRPGETGAAGQPVDAAALETKIELARERAANAISLAFEKVVAHRENPSMYPLPANASSVERAFHKFLGALPNSKRKKMIDKVNETLKATANVRKARYKDIVNVDFKSAVPVVEQVKSMAVPDAIKFTEAETSELFARLKARAEKPTKKADGNFLPSAKPKKNAAPQQAASASNLSFFVDSITCKKTDDVLKDEVNLAGFSIDTNGNSVQLAPLFVGKFKKNDTLGLGGNAKLFTLPIDDVIFPQTFTAGLFIIESDWVSNREALDKLFDLLLVISATISILFLPTLFTLAVVAPAAIPAVCVILGSIVILSMVGKIFASTIGDDISAEVTDTLVVENKIDIGEEFARTLTIEGSSGFNNGFDGEYTVAARWVGEV